jgi:mRNA interferase HigB
VHIITWARCREFCAQHPEAGRPLRIWRKVVETCRWTNHHEMKGSLGQTDVIRGSRVVFNIGGNRYRIVADVRYDLGRVYIRGVFTHAEYDEIDPETI